MRCADRVGDRLHDRRHRQLFLDALHAPDHRGEHDSVAARRDHGRCAERGDVHRPRARAVCGRLALADRHRAGSAAAVEDCAPQCGPQRVRVPRRGDVERLSGRRAPPRGRAAATGVESDRRSPGVQPTRDRQSCERAGDDGSERADHHVQSRGGSDHRRAVGQCRRPTGRTRAAVAREPRRLLRSTGRGAHASTYRIRVDADRRPAHRARVEHGNPAHSSSVIHGLRTSSFGGLRRGSFGGLGAGRDGVRLHVP